MSQDGKKGENQRQPASAANKAIQNDSHLLSEEDIYLFNQGSHFQLYEKMGARLVKQKGLEGAAFSVWAPNAARVCVVGDFNAWNKESHPLRLRGQSGLWEGFIPGVKKGDVYKYHIISQHNNYRVEKADPFALCYEAPPLTASVVWELEYQWHDQEWMEKRGKLNAPESPVIIYEVHVGSWKRAPEDDNRPLTYRELAPVLAEYITRMGFTHVEFLPITEHPFYGSWGYQTVGYFAPTRRYGTPQDFMYLIDYLHQKGIGVILDWVPSHFPNDEHGLGYFDGTHLFEHADPRQGFHPDWKSCIFNYGREEVRSFLISSALFWLEKYHIDGLRMDAVASMLYLDYSRKQGEWVPNRYGGRENLEAIAFLRSLNEEINRNYPQVMTIAEESTAWPMVSRNTYLGGLGFDMKWDMGWMHDTLEYISQDPVYRLYHHSKLTFRMLYAFHENYVLPLSHDEVVHGKGSLLGKMPGDPWQKFANLRLLFGNMFAQPGKKLIFMGAEFGQESEWNHDQSLEWRLLGNPLHSGLQRWVKDLNRMYQSEPALRDLDFASGGFEWIDCNDSHQSTLSLIRRPRAAGDLMIVVFNFTPVPRHNYRIGVPRGGFWREVINSDAKDYGGSGWGAMGGVTAAPVPFHGRPCSLTMALPPLAVIFFKSEEEL